eukprot:1157386-Pelagomonas_calceolata.AAC.7
MHCNVSCFDGIARDKDRTGLHSCTCLQGQLSRSKRCLYLTTTCQLEKETNPNAEFRKKEKKRKTT